MKLGKVKGANRKLILTGLLLSVAAAAGLAGLRPSSTDGSAWAQSQPASKTAVDFNRDIEPILQTQCVKCHGGDNAQARLRLDSEAGILKGGVSGRSIVPGHSSDSLLVKRLMGLADAPRMPMGGDPLPPDKIELIRAWIDRGSIASAQGATNTESFAAPPVENQPQPVASHPQANTGATEGQDGRATGSSMFADQIRPILAARCYQCHGPAVQQNGLRLDSLAAILKGSDSGKGDCAGFEREEPVDAPSPRGRATADALRRSAPARRTD